MRGGRSDVRADSRRSSVPMHVPFTLRSGDRLKFGARTCRRACGARGQGRASTCRRCSAAERRVSSAAWDHSMAGRSRLGSCCLSRQSRQSSTGGSASEATVPLPLPAGGAKLRVIPGPQEQFFTPQAYETLFASRYVITPAVESDGLSPRGSRRCSTLVAPTSSRMRRRLARCRCQRQGNQSC